MKFAKGKNYLLQFYLPFLPTISLHPSQAQLLYYDSKR